MPYYVYQQFGWMPCVACFDSRKLRLGYMYLLKDKWGSDEWCVCPVCNGKGEVPQYKVFDPVTGKEIDYENQERPEGLTDKPRVQPIRI